MLSGRVEARGCVLDADEDGVCGGFEFEEDTEGVFLELSFGAEHLEAEGFAGLKGWIGGPLCAGGEQGNDAKQSDAKRVYHGLGLERGLMIHSWGR